MRTSLAVRRAIEGEFPAEAGLADLTHRLERALERIEELEERVERLEHGGQARDNG